MALRNGSRSSPTKAPAHRLFAPTMLLLVLLTAAALVLYNGSEPLLHPMGIGKTYVARTIQAALQPDGDTSRAKVEALFKQAKYQLVLLNAYANHMRRAKIETISQLQSFTDHANTISELLSRPQIQAFQQDSGSIDEESLRILEKEVKDKAKVTRQMMMDSKEFFDNHVKIQKLKDTMFAVGDQLSKAKKQGEFANTIAARSTPKSLHCLSMRLLEKRISNEEDYAADEDQDLASKLNDPSLYHYVIFSDNLMGASVAVKSAVHNAKHPGKHVFHVVTDKTNLWPMKVWFKMSPPDRSPHIEIKSIEEFDFINPSDMPLLQQLESDNQLKTRKSHIILQHLRFYLPEMYPKLRKVLLLEDDVVVQRDLTSLFEMSLDGKVHAAVETCIGPYSRYGYHLNFSHPLVSKALDPNSCAFAFGLNLFDLDAWRKAKCTEEYHRWQKQNDNNNLWKLSSLPPGLITFYKKTKVLDKSWHVLGLGHNPNVSADKIKKAAVIHYSGSMKPWLDVALNKYRDYWTKYVDYGNVFIQACNFGH